MSTWRIVHNWAWAAVPWFWQYFGWHTALEVLIAGLWIGAVVNRLAGENTHA